MQTLNFETSMANLATLNSTVNQTTLSMNDQFTNTRGRFYCITVGP